MYISILLAPLRLLIMGPKKQNNAMVDEIKALTDVKLEELNKKIDTLWDKIHAINNALQIALEKQIRKLRKPSAKALKIKKSWNTWNSDSMSMKKENLLSQVEEEIEDVKNKSLRTTLIFQIISKTQSEKSWKDTKEMLANQILNVIPGFSGDEVYYNIKRAHRKPLNQSSKSKYKTPVIIAKFINWPFSEKNIPGFIEASQNGDTQTIVSQMYSRKTQWTKKRNIKVQERNETVKSYRTGIYQIPSDINGYER